MKNIIIYSKDYCPYCKAAKALLQRKHIQLAFGAQFLNLKPHQLVGFIGHNKLIHSSFKASQGLFSGKVAVIFIQVDDGYTVFDGLPQTGHTPATGRLGTGRTCGFTAATEKTPATDTYLRVGSGGVFGRRCQLYPVAYRMVVDVGGG